jgi:hypothetical protein
VARVTRAEGLGDHRRAKPDERDSLATEGPEVAYALAHKETT